MRGSRILMAARVTVRYVAASSPHPTSRGDVNQSESPKIRYSPALSMAGAGVYCSIPEVIWQVLGIFYRPGGAECRRVRATAGDCIGVVPSLCGLSAQAKCRAASWTATHDYISYSYKSASQSKTPHAAEHTKIPGQGKSCDLQQNEFSHSMASKHVRLINLLHSHAN